MLPRHRFLLLLLLSLFFGFQVLLPPSRSQGTNHSVLLNGTSAYVDVPYNANLNITGALTIEAWVKTSSTAVQQIVERGDWWQNQMSYQLTLVQSKVRLDIMQSNGSYAAAIGSTTISLDAWHHIAAVYDGSQMRVYLDGVLDGTATATMAPGNNTTGLRIGKSSFLYYPNYFNGRIDEVRISNAAIYSSNFTPAVHLTSTTSTKGLWKFDGQTTNDLSGSNANGSLQGSATYSTDVPTGPNSAPSISLSDPLNNTNFPAGANVVIDATASDSDGAVAQVEFFQGAMLLGSDSTAPYTFVWNNVAAGSYSITARAIDDLGAISNTTPITITVTQAGGDRSVLFNGTSSYVDVPYNANLNITGALTIEAWVKTSSTAVQLVVERGDWWQNQMSLQLSLVESKVRLDIMQSNGSYTAAIGSTSISLNAWHHVAGVYDGSQMRVYLDGVLDGTATATMAPGNNATGLRIGKSSFLYYPYYFNGRIDEVRLSNAAIYSSNFTPAAHLTAMSSTRGLWKFDGETANDSSTSGANGSLQGGATYSTDVPAGAGGGAQLPVAVANGPYSGQRAQSISFSSSGSFDSDGTIIAFHWNFGDGTSSNAATPSHTYQTSGLFTATLTVTDNSGLLASATTSVSVNGSSEARLDPRNATGGTGENPLSRNFNWSLPLLGLSGRAGLDLSLSLAYNSLSWTKFGSYISFDDDGGFPAPGFRLGFPVIQPLYYNSDVGNYAYLLISPDGSRTELRQVATNSVFFESADSSHALLDITNLTSGDPSMLLRTSAGTQLTYKPKGGAYACTEIKDANGNYITINYNVSGRIENIHDTLDRVITFNYDNGLLSTITQVWKQPSNPAQTITHTWASFSYTDLTMQTNFSGLTVTGPANGATVKVLSKVTLADNSTTPAQNSHFDFDYTGYGQVWKISNFAADNQLLNYRAYRLPGSPLWSNAPAQTDCPRFSDRRDWAQNWNRLNETGAEQEAITTFSVPQTGTATVPWGQNPQSATFVQVSNPDGTFSKIYFLGAAGSSSGWRIGLPYLVDSFDVGGTIPQRQAVTTWEQDNENVSYVANPRVQETNIYDTAGNRKRTTITYQTFTPPTGGSYKLPVDILEYAADGTTVLRSSRTVYLDADSQANGPYQNRRVLGLVREKTLYEGNVNTGGTLKSRVAFFYDNENGVSSIQGADAPVQHDNTNYSATFVTGRANLSTTRRYNVDNGQFTAATMKYNTAGAVVSSEDALLHEVKLDYTDAFSDGVLRNTLAYPTKVTDPDGFYSTSKYNFDFGALTNRITPPANYTGNPASQPAGPESVSLYDDLGRLERTRNLVNDAYTRFVYAANGIRTETYATLVEGQGEAKSFKITDGFGRVIATASDHPATPGTAARFDAQRIKYDLMGRVIKTSNPAETSAIGDDPSQWQLVEGDAGSNWVYTQQTYDWKGRSLITTYPDMSTKEASYSGCGCAGGEVVTLTDEGTLVDGTNKKRQQKIYADVLGRIVKSEIWDFDGTGPGGNSRALYSTMVTTYNARDQVTQLRQYAGAEGSGTFQDTTMTYDGYGRLKTRHLPEQQVDPNNNASTDHTTWDYYADDTIEKMIDARGTVSNFLYNQRHLVSEISYSLLAGVPTSGPSGVAATATTTFDYDSAGNRKLMSDGSGSTTYVYDPLSRLTSETRTFTGLGGSYTLGYQYQPDGQLKSLTDHTNSTINYSVDSRGRLTSVTGSGNLVGGVTEYAASFVYRAWGGLKEVTDGSSHTAHLIYNNRMQPIHFDISGGVASQDYEHYNDGRISFVHNNTNNKFDRSFAFDHAGRLTAAASGGAARHDTLAVPMSETFQYNAFGNTTERMTETWLNFFYDLGNYVNGRRNDWSYDADGRVAAIDERSYSYDSAGRNKSVAGQQWTAGGTQIPINTASDYDGDSQRVREIQTLNGTVTTTYYLRSTVLQGTIVEELNSSGQKETGYVYTPAGSMIARQAPGQNYVMLKQLSPIGASQYEFFKSDTTTGVDLSYELDPVGAEIPRSSIHLGQTRHAGDISGVSGGPADNRFGAIENPAAGCVGLLLLDGLPTPCELVLRMAASGAVQVKVGNSRQDIQLFGGSTVWVDAWEDYEIDGRGFLGHDENGNELYDAGTTGTRNVGYFINITGGGPPSGSLNPLPQNPATQRMPLIDFKKLLQQTLDYGDCKEFLAKLITKAGELLKGKNDPESTDIMTLYNKMNGQARGGFRLNHEGPSFFYGPKGYQELPPISGGGGSAYGYWQSSNRTIWIEEQEVYTNTTQLTRARVPFEYMKRVLHEFVHVAAKGELYQHDIMDASAEALETRP